MAERIGGKDGISVAEVAIRKTDGLDSRPARFIKVPIAPSGVAEEDSGIDIPAGCVVLPDVIVEVTVGAGTIDIGLLSTDVGGDANGFVAGLDVSSTGMKAGVLANGAETVGALLKVTTSGGPAARPHIAVSTALSVSYTCSNASMRGNVYIPVFEPFSSND